MQGTVTLTFRAALVGAASLALASTLTTGPEAQQLKSYDSQSKEFWTKPPPDWFLGDETQEQKGQVPVAAPATGIPQAEVEATLKKIKLPQGFQISLWTANIPSARPRWGSPRC